MCFPALNSPEAFKKKKKLPQIQCKHMKDPHTIFIKLCTLTQTSTLLLLCSCEISPHLEYLGFI